MFTYLLPRCVKRIWSTVYDNVILMWRSIVCCTLIILNACFKVWWQDKRKFWANLVVMVKLTFETWPQIDAERMYCLGLIVSRILLPWSGLFYVRYVIVASANSKSRIGEVVELWVTPVSFIAVHRCCFVCQGNSASEVYLTVLCSGT